MIPPPFPPPPPFSITVRAFEHVLNVTLYGDTFVENIGAAERAAIIHGLQSDGERVAGSWEANVLPALREGAGVGDADGVSTYVADAGTDAGAVTRVDESTISIRIPRDVGYDTHAPETVAVSLPGSVLTSRQRTVVAPAFILYAMRGTVRLGGTLLAYNSEGWLRSARGLTLELTLEGDRWSPELNIGERGRELVLELLRGLRAKTKYAAGQALASTEPRGWDTVVQPQLKAHHVVRVDDTTVRVLIPQAANYDIREPEDVRLTVPADALLAGVEVDADDTVRVYAEAGTCQLNGTLLADATEHAVGVGANLLLTLSGDEWTADVGDGASEATARLLEGIKSLQDEAGGWNAVVQPTLTARSLRRVDARRLEISVRAAGYDITAPETLTIVVPRAALLSQQANVTVLPHLVVYPTPGALRLGGTLCQNATVSTQICTNAR